MKNILLILTAIIGFVSAANAQGVNQITISPPNPTANDTIMIISDFSYYGACSFGLVYEQSWLSGSTVNILPTYCGYGATSLCTSIDTFRIGPFSNGNYTVSIEYHQGSVCPFSGFDATIAQFDTLFTVSGTTNISNPLNGNLNSLINISPNPSSGIFSLKAETRISKIEIINTLGENIYTAKINSSTTIINLTNKPKGVCFYQVMDEKQVLKAGKIIIN